MLKKSNIIKAINRKKLWDRIGLRFDQRSIVGYFRNNHSLNCGCRYCRYNTFLRRKENKKNRYTSKLYISQKRYVNE